MLEQFHSKSAPQGKLSLIRTVQKLESKQEHFQQSEGTFIAAEYNNNKLGLVFYMTCIFILLLYFKNY